MFDAYLIALVLLPCGGELLKAQIVGQKRDANKNPVGQAYTIPSWTHVNMRLSLQMDQKRFNNNNYYY